MNTIFKKEVGYHEKQDLPTIREIVDKNRKEGKGKEEDEEKDQCFSQETKRILINKRSLE